MKDSFIYRRKGKNRQTPNKFHQRKEISMEGRKTWKISNISRKILRMATPKTPVDIVNSDVEIHKKCSRNDAIERKKSLQESK